MTTAITVLHVLVCLFLILVVLLQTGRGSEMGAIFGGGGSHTVFGSGGAAPFLTKITSGVAIVFMLTSLILSTAALQPGSSIMDDEAERPVVPINVSPGPAEEAQEALPAAPAAEPQAKEKGPSESGPPQAPVSSVTPDAENELATPPSLPVTPQTQEEKEAPPVSAVAEEGATQPAQ